MWFRRFPENQYLNLYEFDFLNHANHYFKTRLVFIQEDVFLDGCQELNMPMLYYSNLPHLKELKNNSKALVH